MKNICRVLLLIIITFYGHNALAISYPGGPVDPRDVIDTAGNIAGVDLEVENTTYFKLCEIRRMFCGTTQTVMAAAAIFIVGLLITMGKMTWTAAMTVLIGICIFISAEFIAETLTTFPPTLGVIYACYCSPTAKLFSF